MFFRSFSRKHGRISKGALERSPSTNLPKIRPDRPKLPPRKRKQTIVTLDPNKFVEKKQQCLHIGSWQYFTPFYSKVKKSRSFTISPRLHYDQIFKPQTRLAPIPSYPPDTRAFLYYSVLPGRPRIAGELRLRVTSNDDPASFESGSDLLLKNGRPWLRPLPLLSKYYPPLYKILREDQSVPDDLDTILSTLPAIRIKYGQTQYLYTINDPFIVDFGSASLSFVVVTEQGAGTANFQKLFLDGRGKWNGLPYTGSALARFELSTLPEHKGTRTILLRFLKIMTPVECVLPHYDDYICWPKEGELYRKKIIINRVPEWSFNIDKPCHTRGSSNRRSLKLLLDT